MSHNGGLQFFGGKSKTYVISLGIKNINMMLEFTIAHKGCTGDMNINLITVMIFCGSQPRKIACLMGLIGIK